MSDIGGLVFSIFIVVSILLIIFKDNDLDWYLVSKLYTRRTLTDDALDENDS